MSDAVPTTNGNGHTAPIVTSRLWRVITRRWLLGRWHLVYQGSYREGALDAYVQAARRLGNRPGGRVTLLDPEGSLYDSIDRDTRRRAIGA